MTIEQVAQSTFAISHRFWQWWIDELFGCLPKSFDFRMRWSRGEWALLVSPDEMLLGRDHGPDGFEPIERLAISEGKVVPAVGQAGQLAKLDPHAALTLRLPTQMALRCTMRLPIAALENLREAVAFQLDRYTPYSQEQAYFEYAVIQRDDVTGHLVIEATVIAREIVSSYCAMVERLGLHVTAVEIIREDGTGSRAPTRLTVPVLRQRPRAQHALNFAAAIAFLLLVGVAIFFPLARADNEARILARQLDIVRRQSENAPRLETANAALEREATFLAGRASRPSALDVLLEVTKLTGDDSWLESLQFTGAQVDLAGLSSSASALIGRLAQSTVFHDMEFRSPVTPDPRLGRERFQISGQLQAPTDLGPTRPTPPPEPAL